MAQAPNIAARLSTAKATGYAAHRAHFAEPNACVKLASAPPKACTRVPALECGAPGNPCQGSDGGETMAGKR